MSVGARGQGITQALYDIVGGAGVIEGRRALDVYADGAGKSADLIRVLPRTTGEVMQLVGVAREYHLKIFTVRGQFFPESLEGQSGLLIDPVNMNEINNIDSRNLMASIGAGVTFEQLEKELAKQELGLLMPASAESPYVLRSYLERDCLVGSVTFRQPNLSIFHAVLADGRKWVSGTQQLVEEGANFREDQGPQISPIFGGSEDIFGIPVFGIVYVYPRKQERRILAYGFKQLEDAVSFTYGRSKVEHCFEIAGGDATWWSSLTGQTLDLPDWTVLLSIEQHPDLVANQAAQVEAAAKELGAAKLPQDLTTALGDTLRRPWYLKARGHIAGGITTVKYYTFAAKVPTLFKAVSGVVKDTRVGKGFVPVYFGSSFFCACDLHHAPSEADQAKALGLKAYAKVLEQRALIDRGNGALAKMVYAQANPVTVTMVKNFKQIMDPDGILNPGQLMEGI